SRRDAGPTGKIGRRAQPPRSSSDCPMPSIVIVSPTRDEERTVARTIRSMLAQTLRPTRWVIVNDGSTDRTRAIIDEAIAGHDWIECIDRGDRGHRALGQGVVEAFYAGFERVRASAWD